MYIMRRGIICTVVYYHVVCSKGRFIAVVLWMIMFSSQKTLVLGIKRKSTRSYLFCLSANILMTLWRFANVIAANLMQQNLTRFEFWNALLHQCCRRQFNYCHANEKEKGNFACEFYWEVLIARLLKINLVK